MCLEHVGTNSLRSTNEQLPYHQSRLSRLCELYYNRYLHTLRGLHMCVHVRPHVHTPLSKLPQLKSSCIKGSCLLSHFISIIFFLAFSLSPLSLHTFFFFCLFPCAFSSLFPTQSVSHLYLSLLCLPAREILLQREVMFFVLFSSPISGEFTFFFLFFLKCRLKGSISQVLLCPPT